MYVPGTPETLRIVETPDQTLLGGHGVELGDPMRQTEPSLPGYTDLVGL